MTHSVETSQATGGPADPFILRGWICCSICDRLMVPVLVSTRERYYGCANGCFRPPVAAERVERLVWDHFTYLNQMAADQVVPEGRREILREFLARVWVGVDVDNPYFDWRD